MALKLVKLEKVAAVRVRAYLTRHLATLRKSHKIPAIKSKTEAEWQLP